MNENFTETELETLLALVQKTISSERKVLNRYLKSPTGNFNLDDPKADKHLDRIVDLRNIEQKLNAQKQIHDQSTQQQPEDSLQ